MISKIMNQKTNYNCPKGYMKWTHRLMLLSSLLVIIGIILIIYGYIYDQNFTNIWIGCAMLILSILIMLGSMANAYMRGCYKTAFAIWMMMFGF